MAAPDVEAAKAKPPVGLPRWTPSLPTNLIGMLNPFTTDESSKTDAQSSTSVKKTSILSTFFSAGSDDPQPSTPLSPSPDDDSVMFAEPDATSNSDAASREGSVSEKGQRKSRAKCDKSKTCFSMCHPPPTSTTWNRHRLHRRPRSLLQLHRLSAQTRPRPAFDVVPSANFSVKLTKAITKVFRAKHGLCPNDLVVLRAEKYSTNEPDEEQEARDIIALICKGRKEDGQHTGKAKICFADGREWEAYSLPSGGYELFSTDEHGLGVTVRWVPKRCKDGSKPVADRSFNFSTISPNTRRHPVIATLTKTSLSINDSFRIPEPSAVTPLSTPKQGSTHLADAMAEEAGGADICETDDRLREIIIISSIWLTFKEGWSPTFKYDDKDKESMFLPRSPSIQASPPKAGASSTSLLSSPPTSPGPMSPTAERRSSIQSTSSASVLRKGGLLARRSRNSVPEEEFHTVTSPQIETGKKTGRARADSASTVLVHRAASNRARNNAGSRHELLAAQPEAQEAPIAEPFNRSQSDGAVPRSPTLKKSEPAVATPLLPPAPEINTGAPEASGPTAPMPSRSRRRQSPAVGKRESSAASGTTTSTTEHLKTPVKKKGGLRRLLCGSE